MPVTIDGQERPMWSRMVIQKGQKLKIGKVIDGGCRSYLAVKGGFPEMWVPSSTEHRMMLTWPAPYILDPKLELPVFCLEEHRFVIAAWFCVPTNIILQGSTAPDWRLD